jgi:hypothetical protein
MRSSGVHLIGSSASEMDFFTIVKAGIGRKVE